MMDSTKNIGYGPMNTPKKMVVSRLIYIIIVIILVPDILLNKVYGLYHKLHYLKKNNNNLITYIKYKSPCCHQAKK